MNEETEEEYEPDHRADVATKGPFLSSKWYDRLRWTAQIVLPAMGAAYFSLSDFWGLPKATEVVGTCTIVGLFLGTLLGISKRSYDNSDAKFDGELEVFQSSEGNAVRVVSNDDIPVVAGKKEVVLRVNSIKVPE